MSHQADLVLGREIEELLLREVPEPQLDEHLAAVGFQGHPRVELNLVDGGNNAGDLKDPLGRPRVVSASSSGSGFQSADQ